MLHPSTQKLIDRLAEMTALGRLSWSKLDNGKVSYTTEGYAVEVTDAPHDFVILSKTGDELERASNEALANTPQDIDGNYAGTIATLYIQALRIAKGTEAAISSLLADIELDETPAKLPETDIDETGPDVLDAYSSAASAAMPDEDASISQPAVTQAVAKMASEVAEKETASSEPDEIEAAEPAFVEATTPFVYVPFGLNLAPIISPEIASAAAFGPESVFSSEPPEEDIEAVIDTDLPDNPIAEDDAGLAEMADEEQTTDTSPVTLEPEFETDPILDAADPAGSVPEEDSNVVAFAPATDAAAEEVSQPDISNPNEASQEDEGDTNSSSFQSDGIGVGFGLGAINAARATQDTIEVPTEDPSPLEQSDEKIIIDAVDDVPPDPSALKDPAPVRTADPMPDLPSLDNGESAREENSVESDDEDLDDLKPKTRFNPWG